MTSDDARSLGKAVEPPVRTDSLMPSTISKDEKVSRSRQSSKSRQKSKPKKKSRSRSRSTSSKDVELKQPPSPKFPDSVDVAPEEKPAPKTETVSEGPAAPPLASTTPVEDTAVGSAVTGDAQDTGAQTKDPGGNVRFGQVKVTSYAAPPPRPYAAAGVAVGFGCSIVGFMFLALALMLSRTPAEVLGPPKYCESDKQCHEALHYLDLSGDMAEDPCRDFYQHVCYRWMENGSFMGDVMTEFYTLVDSIISPGVLPYPDEYGSHIFVHTYRSCYGFINATNDNASLEGVLPRLLNHSSSLQNLTQKDLVAAIARLSAVEGIDVLFGVGLRTYKNNTYPALWSGRSLRKKFKGLTNFSGLLKEALGKIQSSPPVEGLVEDIVRLDDAVNAAFENYSDTRLLDLSAISDVAEGLKPSELSSLFQEHLHVLQAERFFWTGEIQTKTVLESIKNARRITVQAYLSLQVAADILAFYFRGRSQKVMPQPEMVKTCLVAACRVSSHACAVVSRQLGLVPVSEGDIEALYESDLDQFPNIDNLVPWVDKTRWASLMKVFKNSTVTLLHRIVTPLYNRTRAIYPNVTVWSGNFLEQHLTLMAVHKAASFAYPLDVEVAEFAERQLEGALDFSDYLRSIVVPGALLSAPVLYSATMPTEFNFGTIGALLARKLAHVLTPAGSGDWWNQRLIQVFQESTQCLKEMHRKFERNASGWDIATSSNLLSWTIAAKTALNALLSGGGGIGGLPPLEPGNHRQQEGRKNAMRVFFRRFCLLSCGRDEPGLSARSRCMLPLVGMNDFSAAFDCPVGSVMNPNDTCTLRL